MSNYYLYQAQASTLEEKGVLNSLLSNWYLWDF